MKNSSRLLYISILTSMVFVLVFGITQPVAAFEINNTGRLSRNDVVDDDLFIGGDKVVVDGTVNGLLFAAGNEVIINGTINGDVFAGAQTITVGDGATINGNLFTGAQTVSLSGKVTGSVFTGVMSLVLNENSVVGRNLYFGGYSLEAKHGSVISRDLAAGGYQVILSGDVSRDVKAGVAAFKLDGSIGRNADIQVEKPGTAQGSPYTGPWSPQTGNIKMIDPGLDIGQSASIGGIPVLSIKHLVCSPLRRAR
jgi:cytoskeletal protein CcmA (bactofilin family)